MCGALASRKRPSEGKGRSSSIAKARAGALRKQRQMPFEGKGCSKATTYEDKGCPKAKLAFYDCN
jgi:hypothetical protein